MKNPRTIGRLPAGCRARLAAALAPLLAAVAADGSTFYVNDGTTNGDRWCSAVGSDSNDGLAPNRPLASLQTVLSRHTLGPNDAVYVDAGIYSLTNNIAIATNHGGTANAPMRLIGADRATVFDRGSSMSGSACFSICASNIVVQGFTCRHAEHGIVAYGSGGALTLLANTCCSNASDGITIRATVGAPSGHVTLAGNLLFANPGGIDAEGSASGTTGGGGDSFDISNNTICATGGRGIALGGQSYSSRVRGNIVVADGGTALTLNGTPAVSIDYNDWHTSNGGSVALVLRGTATNGIGKTLGAWQRSASVWVGVQADQHSFSRDPLFANPAAGDFHERSTGGRWSGTWVSDGTDSPCVDAGDPADPVGEELAPNGGRRNLGAFGGTSVASRSPSGRRLLALVPDQGSSSQNGQPVYWFAAGQGWQTDDCVKVEYSLDSGASWSYAAAVKATAGSFSWPRPPAAYDSPSGCLVRVSAVPDPSVWDQVALDPTIHIYYVNDSSTNGDRWCTQPGNDSADGLTPATPVASLATVFARCALSGGDRVNIDTGYYALTSNIVFPPTIGGSGNHPITIAGAGSGTVLDRQSKAAGTACLDIRGSYLSVQALTCVGADIGILVDPTTCCAAEFVGNVLRQNGRLGLRVSGATAAYGCFTIRNNTCVGNGGGLDLASDATGGGNVFAVWNNTVSATTGAAISVKGWSSGTAVRNNILEASAGAACCVMSGGSTLNTDYNSFYIHDGGLIGSMPNAAGSVATLSTLADWQACNAGSANGSARDAHSLARNPFFASPANFDYHLRSPGGRWQPASGTWVTDTQLSPCVDAGDPTPALGDYTLEPAPNGKRINIGADGGTGEASKSVSGRTLQLLLPDAGQTAGMSQTIAWNAIGQGWTNTDTVRLDYSLDSGSTWAPISDAQALNIASGSYSWTARPSDSFTSLTGICVRITANADSTVTDTASLPPLMHAYYVNDGATVGDLWCTQPGSANNDGLTPATPAASVQSILDRYTLTAGDTLFVDAGYYALASNIVVESRHNGFWNMPIRIRGAKRATVIDRQSGTRGAAVFLILGNHLSIEGCTLAGGDAAVSFSMSGYPYQHLLGNTFRGQSRYGVLVDDIGMNGQLDVANNLFTGIGAAAVFQGGVGCHLQFSNNTVAVSQGAGLSLGVARCGASVRNNIFDVAGSACALDVQQGTVYYMSNGYNTSVSGSGMSDSDYNDYFMHDGGVLARRTCVGSATNVIDTFRTLSAWQSVGCDADSLSRDPLFASVPNGDYHLKSTGGRWSAASSTGWITDALHSPCIDAGDPSGSVGSEPTPNGGRINLGAFGGTVEASKSAAARTLRLAAAILGTSPPVVTLSWQAGGQAWSAGDTVRLDYSIDGGRRWQTFASSIPYAWSNGFNWAPGTQLVTSVAADIRVRVTCNQDGSVSDTLVLGVRTAASSKTYYINDASLTGDVYCSAPGSAANSGLSPATPLDSLASLLASRTLGPGDTVYVDTGTYASTSSVTLTRSSAGAADRYIRIVGSTNGSVLSVSAGPGGSAAGIELHADYVRVERLTCVGGKVGIAVDAATCRNAQLMANICFSNGAAGIEIKPWTVGGGSTYQVLENVCWSNGAGLFLQGHTDPSANRAVFTVENNTLANNNGPALVSRNAGLSGWRTTNLKNNLLRVILPGVPCLAAQPGSLSYSDFNAFDAVNGAVAASWLDATGGLTSVSGTLADWQSASGGDSHSLWGDSGLVAPTQGDFRLSPSSPCIDAGVNGTWIFSAQDAAGRERLFGRTIDIGAYESSRRATVRLFLQGPYDAEQHAMNATLAASGLLPLTSPYAADPHNVSAVPADAVDWVLLQVRDGPDGTPIASHSAFVRGDGYVIEDDGNPNLRPSLPPGTNWFVAVKHRNHVAVVSAAPIVYSNETWTLDFTAGADRYLGGAAAAVEVEPGVWALASGDADGDGHVGACDRAVAESQLDFFGYRRGDLNLDGWVDAASDLALIDAQLGRAAACSRAETLLLPMMRLQPQQSALLSGNTQVFSAAPALDANSAAAVNVAAHWAFADNPSGGTLETTDFTAAYTAGAATGTVDTIEAWDPASDALGRASVSVFGTPDAARAGQVVIAAGRKSAADPLWPATDYLAGLAYNTMRYRGFDKARLHYFNPETDEDVDGNGAADDIDGPVTAAALAAAIANACADGDRLFLYLADHGGDSAGNGFFRLSPEETLSAAELGCWLNALQDTYHTEVTVLLDFCYSGSFVDELAYTGTARRIVIAACDTNQPSYFVAGGLVSFSEAFLDGVLLGYDVAQSFDLARQSMAVYQQGLLDADKSGRYDAAADPAAAAGYFIGPSTTASSELPTINSVCANQVLTEETSATLWVSDISALSPLARVWCQIVPPGFAPNPDNPVTALPELELSYDADSGQYAVTCDAFTAPGTYDVLFYASDVDGRVSTPRQCYVTQVGYDDRLVLVAGAPANEASSNAVHYLARLAASTFRLRLFATNHVCTLSPFGAEDLDGDGAPDTVGAPTLASLEQAITGWALTNSTDRLTLYFAGNGAANALRLNDGEALDAATLAGWLDAFQSAAPVPVVVILDFAGAGAFIPALALTNEHIAATASRIVIASSEANREALLGAGGTVSFSQYLLSGLMAGENLGEAFTAARRAIRRVSGGVRQRATIDDNGDGIASEKNVDGEVAATTYLGSAFVTGADTPVIGAVTPLTVLTNGEATATLWASDLSGIQAISNVWCTVTPPEADGADALVRVDLAWNAASGRYEATCTGFTKPGSYALSFQCMDAAGEVSDVVLSEIVRADAFEPDDTIGQAALCYGPSQVHTFHSADDVDWVRFYLVSDLAYEISTEPLSAALDTVLDLYRALPDGTLELIDHVDEEGSDAGEYTGLDFPSEGFYYARLSPYTLEGNTGSCIGSYEFSVSVPSAVTTYSLIVLGLDDTTSGALPSNTTASVTGQTNKTFNGVSTSVTFTGLTNGTYTVSVSTPTNFFPREDPNTPYQVSSLTNLFYANPRRITINNGWYMTGFEMIPYVLVTNGWVRDAWTHAYVTNALISFTAISGSLTGTVVDGSIILTGYHTDWVTQATGRFPTNMTLASGNWNLCVTGAGYCASVTVGAISNVTRGAKLSLGTTWLTPLDINSNGIADAWEQQYFGGPVAATNDADHDGLNNLAEYLAGTSPLSAADVLAVTGIVVAANGATAIGWRVTPYRSYRVDATTNLAAAWFPTGGVWEAAAGATGMSWTSAPSATPHFYRVALTNAMY